MKYRIKPLEWKWQSTSWVRRGLFGRKTLSTPQDHLVAKGVGGIYILNMPVDWDAWWQPTNEPWQRLGRHIRTEKDAKSLCESHHHSRLLECLEEIDG